MAKPSIFSKNYQKAVKKRRKRIAVTIISIICILGIVAYMTLSGNKNLNIINSVSKKIGTKKEDSKGAKNSKGTISKKPNKKQENTKNTQNKKEEKTKNFTLELSENLNVKVSYEEIDNKRIYKEVLNSKDNGKVYYDINPSKTALIVFEEETQKIFFIDNSGNISDISKEKYISKKGNVFLRKTKIEKDKNYVWCETPKFIDENTVAFISQLPWLTNNTNKFIWFGNAQEKKYKYVRDKQGENIEFQNFSDKGLVVKIDDTIYYMTKDGHITQ